MRHFTTFAAIALTLLMAPVLAGCGGGGESDDFVEVETVARAVGAAFRSPTDERIVLVSTTGTRFVYFDPASGQFSPSEPISALPFAPPTLGAASFDGEDVHFTDLDGSMRMLSDGTSSSGPGDPWDDVGATPAPFSKVSAMFTAGDTLFVFNEGGSSYAAVSLDGGTWSPAYSFSSDFGGGGAPIAAVGASFTGPSGNDYHLFDRSGTRWTIYSGNGVFSPAFTLDELGDGALSFN